MKITKNDKKGMKCDECGTEIFVDEPVIHDQGGYFCESCKYDDIKKLRYEQNHPNIQS